MLRRLRRRLARTVIGDRRLQLVADVERCGEYMGMVRLSASAMGAPTLGAAVSRAIWMQYAEEVRDWAQDSDR
jgi:hypothetical protein